MLRRQEYCSSSLSSQCSERIHVRLKHCSTWYSCHLNFRICRYIYRSYRYCTRVGGSSAAMITNECRVGTSVKETELKQTTSLGIPELRCNPGRRTRTARASPHFISLRFLQCARQVLAMRWPDFWSSKGEKSDEDSSAKSPGEVLDSLIDAAKPSNSSSATPPPPRSLDLDWHSYFTPQTIVSTVILTSGCIGFYKFYRTFLRRIPAAVNISPRFFRKRSVFGKVTSVGDGDNFRIYHTPGGTLAGWGWWRSIPTDKKALKNNTV